MTDRPEQKKIEVQEANKTPDKTERESTIGDDAKQKTWGTANEISHQNDEHPSEIDGFKALKVDSFGIDLGDGEVLTAKGKTQKECSMTTSETKALGGQSADMMFEAIESMPEGPEKIAAKEAVKQAYIETRKSESDFEADNLHALSNEQPIESYIVERQNENSDLIKTAISKQNPWQAYKNLPPDFQQRVIKAFEDGSEVGQESIHQTSDDILKETIEGYKEAVQAPFDILKLAGKGLWSILEFERDLVTSPDKAKRKAGIAGDHIGQGLVAGIQLFTSAGAYGTEIHQGGDYSRPFRDLGNGINKWYDGLTPGDQMHVMANISVGFGIGAAAGQLRNLVKPGAFVEFLEETVKAVPKNPEAQAKAAESIKQLIHTFSKSKKPLTPALETGVVDSGGQGLKSQIDRTTKALEEKFDELHHKMTGDKAFRGDHEPYSPINSKSGIAKSFINKSGDLTPADPVGLFKGKPVDVVHHLCGSFYKYHKQFSPFTSLSETGEIIMKYGQRYKITADLKSLEKAIASGNLTGVEIIPHNKVLQMITDSPCAPYSKKLAMSYATRDKEILIRGVIPKRFFTIEDLHK